MTVDEPSRDGSGNGAPLGVANKRVNLRPIGSPLPLGILALIPAGVTLSVLQIGGLQVSEGATVALVLIAFVAPLQLITSVLSFLARDTVAGTALGLFAGAWLATGLTLMSLPPGATSPALGVFLISVAACFLLLVAGAAFGKAGPAIVIVVGAARFLLAGLYEIDGSVGVEHAAAIVGFVLAGVALYTALATELEDVRGEIVLPLLRRGMARGALEAPLEAQVQKIEREAGIRQQL
jgi:succinate-acetate transporter protein